MEIEKKYRIDDSAPFEQLTALETLGPYRLRHSSHTQQQHNTYYDTADRLLESTHYGLRIRSVDGRSIATLKGPDEGQNGLAKRGEWEIEAHDPHPATWPQSDARSQAYALLGDRPLQQLLTIQTQRRNIIALRDDQEIAELSLDEGTIQASGQNRQFRELEIELLPAGSETDLEALESALRAYMPLNPEPKSKLQRGIELLRSKPDVA